MSNVVAIVKYPICVKFETDNNIGELTDEIKDEILNRADYILETSSIKPLIQSIVIDGKVKDI